MKSLALFFLASLSILGQTLSMSTSGVAFPGGTIGVTVNLTGSTGVQIAAISGSLPTTGVTNLVAGSASTTATKTLIPMTPSGFLLIGFSAPSTITNNVYTDGPIATFSYLVPSTLAQGGSFTLAVTNPLAAAVDGTTVALTATPLTLQAGIAASCFTAIQTAISTYDASGANQTQLAMGGIQVKFKMALATGTCQ